MQYTNSLSEVAGTQHSILRDFLHLPSPHAIFTVAMVTLLSDDTSRIIAPSQLFLLITIVASCHQHHFACRFITF